MTSKSGSSPPEAEHPSHIEPLFSAEVIAARVQTLAGEILARPAAVHEPLVLVGLLRGAIPFVTDLARALGARGADLAVDYMRAKSYGAHAVSSGKVTIESRPLVSLRGRDVLIVDDILDTGLTIAAVLEAFAGEAPARLATCVLLDKQARRLNGYRADFVGFSCPDLFVVGYGMDLDDRFRELPFIGTLASV